MTQESERIRQLFTQDIERRIALVDLLSDKIAHAGERIVQSLLADGRIFIAGLGASMANSLHFSTALQHYFSSERPSLPVINLSTEQAALSSMANAEQFDQTFSRPLQALAQAQDSLILLSSSGNSKAMTALIKSAHDKGLSVIALTGLDGGALARQLTAKDIELRVPGTGLASIREIHLFILHCFCDLIDGALFGIRL